MAIGESDLLCGFFTETHGQVALIARAARKSTRRFAALEPMHQLRLGYELRAGAETGTLLEAAIERPRAKLTLDLARLDAAGHALRWVRRAAHDRSPEPALFRSIVALLDALDADATLAPRAALASFGLELLADVGWGLELDRCVRCGKACDEGASAMLDPAAGGLVCRACGGGPSLVRAPLRARMKSGALIEEDADFVIDLVESTLAAHA